MKHYELTIPEEYKVDKVIDAKNPKTGVIMNLVALIIMAIICAIGIIIYIQVNDGFEFEVDENNFNYLLQNAMEEEYVMTTSVTIGDTTLGYCGLKTKGAYTLEHAYTDNPGSDRFSFTVNFGKYIKKADYGKKQNFYGCNKN